MQSALPYIGKIVKAHGTKGDVIFDLQAEADDLSQLEIILLKNARGDTEPFRVEKQNLVLKSNRVSFFVKFEHVSNRSQAEALVGREGFVSEDDFEACFFSDEEDDISGYSIVDGNLKGTVITVIADQANPLLEVEIDEISFLVPYSEGFISEIDDETETVFAQNLEMLMEAARED